jgi:hypothetical protein
MRVYSKSFHLSLEVLARKITSLESWLRLFVFGTAGQLFFSDYDRHFAIFNLISAGAGGVELVRFAVGNGTQPPVTKVAFHHSEPLIVLSNDLIQVWNYDESTSGR